MAEQARIYLTAKDMTKQAFRSVNSNMSKMKQSAKAVAAALSPLAGAASVAGIVAMGKRSLETADSLAKMSKRIGASVEDLSAYQLVAKKSGIEMRTLTMGWQRMTRRVSEAAQGTGEAQMALRELGLDAGKLNQLDPAAQFEMIADSLSGVGNQADRVRLAMKLFDSEGVSLVQAMGGGADAIRRMKDEARELGLVLSTDQAAAAEEAADRAAELDAAVTGLVNTVTIYATPALSGMADVLTGLIKDFGMTNARVLRFEADWKRMWASGMDMVPALKTTALWLREQAIAADLRADQLERNAAANRDMSATSDGVNNNLGVTAKMLSEAARIHEQYGDRQELLNEAVARYGQLLRENLITEREHDMALEAIQSKLFGVGETGVEQMGLVQTASEAAAGVLSSSFKSAIDGTRAELLDLGSLFVRVMGAVIDFGISSAVGSIFSKAAPSAAGATAGGSSAGVTVGSINVSGAYNMSGDPMAKRAIAEGIYDELRQISSRRGAGGRL